MRGLALILLAAGAWWIDSAVRGRSPVAAMREILTTGSITQGVSQRTGTTS